LKALAISANSQEIPLPQPELRWGCPNPILFQVNIVLPILRLSPRAADISLMETDGADIPRADDVEIPSAAQPQ
jgi:hypothetical protein